VKKENVTVRNGKIILNTKRLDQAVNDEKNEKNKNNYLQILFLLYLCYKILMLVRASSFFIF